jgi:hypothetical protein
MRYNHATSLVPRRKKFPCNHCSFGFDFEENLEKHMALHTWPLASAQKRLARTAASAKQAIVISSGDDTDDDDAAMSLDEAAYIPYFPPYLAQAGIISRNYPAISLNPATSSPRSGPPRSLAAGSGTINFTDIESVKNLLNSRKQVH